jgi:hypothetical protein
MHADHARVPKGGFALYDRNKSVRQQAAIEDAPRASLLTDSDSTELRFAIDTATPATVTAFLPTGSEYERNSIHAEFQ